MLVTDRPLTPRAALVAAINGNLYTALYFFWIVLGLSLIAPILIPFIAETGSRGALVAGLGFAAIPVVTIATMQLRGVTTVLTDLAWTWWLPYLGFFLLGWALRRVTLRGLPLAVAATGTAALGALVAWQWRNPAAPSLLQAISPVSYYSLTVLAYSVGVFVTAHSLVQPRGPLSFLTRPWAVSLGRLLGDATLGVFALHLTVLYVVLRLPGIGGAAASPSGSEMLARVVLVLVTTYVLVLTGRRIPGVRALL